MNKQYKAEKWGGQALWKAREEKQCVWKKVCEIWKKKEYVYVIYNEDNYGHDVMKRENNKYIDGINYCESQAENEYGEMTMRSCINGREEERALLKRKQWTMKAA